VFPLEKQCPWVDTGCTAIYVVRPSAACVKTIADHIEHVKARQQQQSQGAGSGDDIGVDSGTFQISRSIVVFVPQRDFVCEEMLEQEGVYGDVIITSLPMFLYPLDDDVLSLELPGLFADLFVHGDQTSLPWIARSILQIEQLYGWYVCTYTRTCNLNTGCPAQCVLLTLSRRRRQHLANACYRARWLDGARAAGDFARFICATNAGPFFGSYPVRPARRPGESWRKGVAAKM